jgi:hypothetical protein
MIFQPLRPAGENTGAVHIEIMGPEQRSDSHPSVNDKTHKAMNAFTSEGPHVILSIY